MERSIPILEGCAARLASSKTVFWLQGITTVWMLVECAVSLYAASAARSVALLTFGADSLIELLSAIVVLLSFIPSFPIAKDRAARWAGILLFALAGLIAITVVVTLMRGNQPESS